MATQGSRLKKIRTELELSQEKMGEYFELSKQYWSNFENDRDMLNNEKLVKLVQYFKVNINYVLLGIGEMFLPDEKAEKELAESVIDDSILTMPRHLELKMDELNKKFDKLREDLLDKQ